MDFHHTKYKFYAEDGKQDVQRSHRRTYKEKSKKDCVHSIVETVPFEPMSFYWKQFKSLIKLKSAHTIHEL